MFKQKISMLAIAATLFAANSVACTPAQCTKIADSGKAESYMREQLLGSEKAKVGLQDSIVYKMSNCKTMDKEGKCNLTKNQFQFLNMVSIMPIVSALPQFQWGTVKNEELSYVLIPYFTREFQIYFQTDKTKSVANLNPDVERKYKEMIDRFQSQKMAWLAKVLEK